MHSTPTSVCTPFSHAFSVYDVMCDVEGRLVKSEIKEYELRPRKVCARVQTEISDITRMPTILFSWVIFINRSLRDT